MMSLYRVIVFSDLIERDEYLVIAQSTEEAENRWRESHESINYTSIMVSSPITEIDGFEIRLVKKSKKYERGRIKCS